jgi:glycosyltransferase involved in cell wall biosynthesis
MRVLILSAYDAVSHKQLNSGLMSNVDADFTLLGLPPRFFAWRTKGNSLSFAFENREELTRGYDLIFATSLTDITSLRGFVPELAHTPLIVYFHENQFDYPENRSEYGTVETKITSIYNALAADTVVFNTEYNRQSFLKGASALLKKMPDHVPAGLVDMIKAKSRVISVPVYPVKKGVDTDGKPVILWNHRWEYDKAPERFLAVLRSLKRRGADFRLNLAGQTFRNTPESYGEIMKEFADHIDHEGYAPTRESYEDVVASSNVIISTSLHDFQGLSVIEASDAGCIPVLPQRVAYTEIFDKKYLYACSDDIYEEAEHCAELILNRPQEKCDMSRFYWENLKGEYQSLFENTAK